MSSEAIRWVDHESRTAGTRRAVLRALALKADVTGRHAAPTWAWLAERAGVSRATVARTLNALRADSLIRRHSDECACGACETAARHGAVVYDLAMAVDERVAAGQQTMEIPVTEISLDAAVETPLETGLKGSQGSHPETGARLNLRPLKENNRGVSLSLDHVEPDERLDETASIDANVPARAAREGAPARGAGQPKPKPVTYRGRTVPLTVVEIAEQLLAAFNDATSGQLAARGRQGQATAALKQIVGALLERPDESLEVWERGVRSMIAEPPSWIDGRFTVGHLFGLRAAEHTLARGRQGDGWAPFAAPRHGANPDWGAIADKLEAQGAAA